MKHGLGLQVILDFHPLPPPAGDSAGLLRKGRQTLDNTGPCGGYGYLFRKMVFFHSILKTWEKEG